MKKNSYYNFFLFIIGMLLISLSINLFYYPNNILPSGLSSISIIINHYLNIDLSLVLFCTLLIILILSFLIFGDNYGIKIIPATIIFPLFIGFTSLFNKIVVFDNISLFILVLTGSIVSGLGIGFIKKSGYNIGGFEVIYDILVSKYKISYDSFNLIINIIVIILSILVFGFNTSLYVIIGIYVRNIIANKVIFGISGNKAFYIVTKKDDLIKDYLTNDLGCNVTIVNARGGYSNNKKKLLLCVIPTSLYIRLKEVVKEIDNDAFFLITDSYFVSK